MNKVEISGEIMEVNLTEIQLDENGLSKYAVFLPATSSFYATFIGKQRFGEYIPYTRVPKSFVNGVESLNYLDPDKGLFYYKWSLYSAGHAKLDLNKPEQTEDMFRNRNKNTSIVIGDSGGFQIGKGVWAGEWRAPTSTEVKQKMAKMAALGIEQKPILDKSGNVVLTKQGNVKTTAVNHAKAYQGLLDSAQKKREQVLTWMDSLMDYGMILDIPAWTCRDPASMLATGISSYQDAVNATRYNNEYFIKNRNGNCKFLNVLQGENHTQAENWYVQMKDFCDPKIYGDKAFNGWAAGGQLMCSPTLAIKMVRRIIDDGLMIQGQHDWMHFLGTSKLEWAVFLTDIQKAVRKYHNPNFTISFDCASPFLATANGQIYVRTELEDRKKWVYRMVSSADDKKYAKDTRLFKDAVIQDGIFPIFESSPVIDQCEIKDVCIYAPGDLNKAGKENSTSWDSFSYAIQMGHNVYAHLNAVLRANQVYENKQSCPAMLVSEVHERIYIGDLVDQIFAADMPTALKLIKKYDRILSKVIGTRGATGKKETNSSTSFNALFSYADEHSEEFTTDEEENLDTLENSL